MTPELTLTTAESLTAGLISREQSRSGGSQKCALELVARRTGVLKSTLEMIVRGRLKRLEAWVLGRLVEAAIADLEGEIRRQQHELEVARHCAGYLAPGEVRTVVARLEALYAALDCRPGPGAGALGKGPRPAARAAGGRH